MATNWKKIRKITFIILGVSLLIIVSGIGYFYYQYQGKFPIDKEKYLYNVEYINPEIALLNDNFKVCDENRIAQYYNPPRATFSKGKNGLRKFILSNYKNKNYSDSGYLNIRFIINCEGEAGRYIIHENDLNLEPKKFTPDLKEQLFDLTASLKKWIPNYFRDKTWDSHMYISYRIENGEITEILP